MRGKTTTTTHTQKRKKRNLFLVAVQKHFEKNLFPLVFKRKMHVAGYSRTIFKSLLGVACFYISNFGCRIFECSIWEMPDAVGWPRWCGMNFPIDQTEFFSTFFFFRFFYSCIQPILQNVKFYSILSDVTNPVNDINRHSNVTNIMNGINWYSSWCY